MEAERADVHRRSVLAGAVAVGAVPAARSAASSATTFVVDPDQPFRTK